MSTGLYKQSAQAAGLIPAANAQKVAGTSFREQVAIQKAEQASQQASDEYRKLQAEEELKKRVAAEQAAKEVQLGRPLGGAPSKQAAILPGYTSGPSKTSAGIPGNSGSPPASPPAYSTQPATPATPPAYTPPQTYEAPIASPPIYPTGPSYPTYEDSGVMPNVPTGTGSVGPNPFTFFDDAEPLTPSKASKAVAKVDSTPATEAKKTLWERILAFFGLAKASTKPSFTGEDFENEIAEIVQRSRAGDQNATAMICMITKNAEKGNPTAIRSAKAIDKYIDAHPVPEPLFGYDGPIISCIMHGPFTQCASFGEEEVFIQGEELSRQPIIPNANIRKYLAQFGEEGKRDFAYGFLNAEKVTPSDPNYHKPLVQTGKAIGIARRLQVNRYGNQYNPQIGWDIGE